MQDIIEILLDESVHKNIERRRRKEVLRQGEQFDTPETTADVSKVSREAQDTWKKNNHIQRLQHRIAKRSARENSKKSKEERQSTLKDYAAYGKMSPEEKNKALDLGINGQAVPRRDHIQHYAVVKRLANTKGADHEKGHAKQYAAIYAKGGTKAIANTFNYQTRLAKDKKGFAPDSAYGKSAMEHNANHYAQEGDTPRVRKERDDIAKAACRKGGRDMEKVDAAHLAKSKLSEKEYGEKNFDDQNKLTQTPKDNKKAKHESVFIGGVTLK